MKNSSSIQNKENSVAFLASLCLFLAAIEFAIPKPLPFMRVGLANMPIVIGLYLLSWEKTLLLMLLKVFCQGILTGTLFSYVFLFSLAGSLASVFAMLAVQRSLGRLSLVSPIGVSLTGSFASTCAQLFLSRFLLFGASVQYVAPVLLISGTFTGCILGFFSAVFMIRSKWFHMCLKQSQKNMSCRAYSPDPLLHNRFLNKPSLHKSICLFFLLLAGGGMLFFQKNMLVLWTTVLVFAICTYFRKKRLRVITPFIIFLTVTVLNLFPAQGKIIYVIGSIKITEGALFFALQRSGILLGMVFLSQATISSSIYLPGRLGQLFSTILYYYEELTTHKIQCKKTNKTFETIIDKIDSRLLAVY
ncbi:MAG TPA: Gx transporter family protein [Treponemataceae bacterium]|nr:Gx transporter family protein [Treponemataceae bacterium]